MRITLTANAGVILRSEQHSVLIDALHNDETLEFSSVSDDELLKIEEMFSEKHPDLVLTTHMHPDHCSERLIRRFSRKWPETAFLFPEDFPSSRLESRIGNIGLISKGLTHDGENFRNIIHRGYIITLGGFNILHIGDASLFAEEEVLELVRDRTVDAAVMNFPWVTLAAGRRFLENRLKPRHLLVVHLPFEDKDESGFRRAAYAEAERLSLPDVRVMGYPMQTEYIKTVDGGSVTV